MSISLSADSNYKYLFLNFAVAVSVQVPGATHLGCFEDTNDKEKDENGDEKSFRILQGANYDLDTTNSPLK